MRVRVQSASRVGERESVETYADDEDPRDVRPPQGWRPSVGGPEMEEAHCCRRDDASGAAPFFEIGGVLAFIDAPLRNAARDGYEQRKRPRNDDCDADPHGGRLFCRGRAHCFA